MTKLCSMCRTFTVLSLVVGVLSACTGIQDSVDEVIPNNEARYRNSRSLPPLEIPPELSTATIDEELPVPEAEKSPTFSGYASDSQGKDRSAMDKGTVLPESPGIRMERGGGDQRWLVIDATPEQVWPRVREFWLENGPLIAREDSRIGIMETEWAEKRLEAPKGFVRSLVSKISESLYGPLTRDKFRVRLERGAQPSTTELYLSHRGLEQVATGASPKDASLEELYVWQPRPPDSELEAEMLNRIVVFFGVPQEKAKEVVLAKREQPAERAKIVQNGNGVTTLALADQFPRAWRRTGLALDRVGFTVEDRNREEGMYFVRYVDPLSDSNKEEGGFFSRLFGGDDDEEPQKEYKIHLMENGGNTGVEVLTKEGQPDASPTAGRILSLLHEQLK